MEDSGNCNDSAKGKTAMRTISWKYILRVISALTLVVSIGWMYIQPGFEPLLAVLGAVGTFIVSFFVENGLSKKGRLPTDVVLYDPECGDKGIDLAHQRLRVSAAFGSYFTSLLETEQSYISLDGQIDCPPSRGQEGLSPIQRIFWAFQDPKGPRTVIVAAEGGMGKSTLAAKIVRCLYEREAVDMILGDSAKSKHADPVTGYVLDYTPGFTTLSGLYHRLCMQLGVPYENDDKALQDIRRRLVGRRAVIVVDNLDSVSRNEPVLEMLLKVTGRDIRSIVTTRQITDLTSNDQQLLVFLKPIKDRNTVIEFLRWHIDRYQHVHPRLVKVAKDIENKTRMQWLIERSGGIPLLLQLLISDIARSSWEEVQRLPNIFGAELLNYLYGAHWKELGILGTAGLLAREVLQWINHEQCENRRITHTKLIEWAQSEGKEAELKDALDLLYARFLIVNRDQRNGNFAVFPSLSEFLMKLNER